MDGSTVIFLLGMFALVAMIVALRYGEEIKAKVDAILHGVHESEADHEAADDFTHLEDGLAAKRDQPARTIRARDRGLTSSRKQRV